MTVAFPAKVSRFKRVAMVRNKRAATVNPMENHRARPDLCADLHRPLRLLSFNIQVGIHTRAYRQYVTKGWQHLLPHDGRNRNLARIAGWVSDYDIVGLQEVDGGSLRSGYTNQVEALSLAGGFPYWYAQTNRDLGRWAQHGNGLLSRIRPSALEDHPLPGTIPGRGALFVRLPYAGSEVLVVLLHLSLGRVSQQRQLAYVAERVQHARHVIVMGDMNTHLRHLLEDSPLCGLGFKPSTQFAPTYPAWRPEVALDHILVSDGLRIQSYATLDCRVSDHLPVAVEIALDPASTKSSLRAA